MATVTQLDVAQEGVAQCNPFFIAVLGGVHAFRALTQLRAAVGPAGSRQLSVTTQDIQNGPEGFPGDADSTCNDAYQHLQPFAFRSSVLEEAAGCSGRFHEANDSHSVSLSMGAEDSFSAASILGAAATALAVLTSGVAHHHPKADPRPDNGKEGCDRRDHCHYQLPQEQIPQPSNSIHQGGSLHRHHHHAHQQQHQHHHRHQRHQLSAMPAGRVEEVARLGVPEHARRRAQQQPRTVTPGGQAAAVAPAPDSFGGIAGRQPPGLNARSRSSGGSGDGCAAASEVTRQEALGDQSISTGRSSDGGGPALGRQLATAAGPPQAWLQATTVCAGAACRTLAQVAIHPLDTLKTRLQVRLANPQLQMWRAVMSSPAVRTRAMATWVGPAGLRDVFLGLGAAVAGTLPASALYFATEQAVRNCFARVLSAEDRDSPPCRLAASAAAASLSALVRVPADVVKHRVQAYAYPSAGHAARDILATRGPAGLYAGFGATLLRDAPEIVVQFTVYGQLKALLERAREQHRSCHSATDAAGASAGAQRCRQLPAAAAAAGAMEHLAVGGVAGAAAALLTTPLDVVKTQLQCGAATSVVGAVRQVMRSGGPAALFGGVAPRVAQTAMCSAIFFTLFEATKAHLGAAVTTAAAEARKAPDGSAGVAAVRSRAPEVATVGAAVTAVLGPSSSPRRPRQLLQPQQQQQQLQLVRDEAQVEAVGGYFHMGPGALAGCGGAGPLAPVAAYAYAYAGAAVPAGRAARVALPA